MPTVDSSLTPPVAPTLSVMVPNRITYSPDGQAWQEVVSNDGVATMVPVNVAAPTIALGPGNSTITLQDVIDDAHTLGDVSPTLAVGGFSDGPARSIATDVMRDLLLGGPAGQPFNWKWNRYNVPAFATNSYQQDYMVPGVVLVGWLENAWMVNINQAVVRKQKGELEVKRDLDVAYEGGTPGKICWLPNDQLQTGTWGQHPLGPTAALPNGENVTGTGLSGLLNPGPNVVYTNPVGTVQTPTNPVTCITDPNGNLWVLTTYGTCGSTQPVWSTTPAYPTYQNQNIVATTVTDGTCVWTAVNPKGQGFRLDTVAPQAGTVWMVTPIAQKRPPMFVLTAQTLEPVPDDYATYFKQGFFAECYRRNPDPKVRAKYAQEKSLWMETLSKAVRSGSREQDTFGFIPGSSVMSDGGYGGHGQPRPDRPYNNY